MSSAREWTDEQLSIFSEMASGSGHLQINASAGTGKTSVLEEGARRASLSALYLVFNKRNEVEAKARMPAGIECRTFNSLGHRAWCRGSRANLDQDKISKLTKEYFRTLPSHTAEDLDFGNIIGLVRKARVSGLVPDRSPGTWRTLLPDTQDSWDWIGDTFDLDSDPESIHAARTILRQSIGLSLNRTPTIDFDDQIYMSTLFGGSFTRFSVILVDEAQDLSPLQHHMVRRSLASGGRVISVGDRRQAIYGFRGADSSSMDSLAAMFPGEFLPLTMSFRCPQTVVLEAQKVAPEIRPWPGADLGTVDTLPKWRPASIESRSVVLCRTNAPLLKVAWEILASGRGVSVLGTDIGKGLIRLIDKLSPTSMPTISFLSVLDAWAAGEIAARPNVEAKISDKVESIRALSGQCATTDDLKSLINRLFSDQTSMITLSSIHKSKGLEWPHVWFLDSWRIPSPFARQPWEREQELNAKYVGITRAQSALTYINAADIEET